MLNTLLGDRQPHPPFGVDLLAKITRRAGTTRDHQTGKIFPGNK